MDCAGLAEGFVLPDRSDNAGVYDILKADLLRHRTAEYSQRHDTQNTRRLKKQSPQRSVRTGLITQRQVNSSENCGFGPPWLSCGIHHLDVDTEQRGQVRQQLR